MTSYPLSEVDQRTKECGPQWRAAFDACVVDREPNGKWVRVDRSRDEWQEVMRIGAACAAPTGLRKLAHGAAGVAKALTGIGRADDATINARTVTCLACPHAKTMAGILIRCDVCGCAVKFKVRVKGERCPDNPPRW